MKENNKDNNNKKQSERKPAPKRPYTKYDDIENIYEYLNERILGFTPDYTYYNDKNKEVELLKEYLRNQVDEDYQTNKGKSNCFHSPTNEDEVRLLKDTIERVDFDVYYGSHDYDYDRRDNVVIQSRYIEVNDANHDVIDQLIKINELVRQYNESPVETDLFIDEDEDYHYGDEIPKGKSQYKINGPFGSKSYDLMDRNYEE